MPARMPVDRKRIYHKRDRLRQLRAFCHAARSQSIARAAANLGVTQPAVSMQIRELEHELEAVLFERIGPGVALSPAGEQLLAIAEPLVEAMDRLPEVLTEQSGGSFRDELRIAAGPGAVAFVLPPYIRQLRDEHPGLRLKMSTRRVGEALKRLGANEVDLAVGAEQFGTKGCTYHPAFTYELVLITSLDHPLAGRESVDIREVARYPAVVPHAGSFARRFGERVAREFGVELNIAVEARGWGVLKGFVEAGIGISVIPDFCVRERDPLSVIAMREYVGPRNFGFFARRGRRLPLAAERLIEIAQAQSPPSDQPQRNQEDDMSKRSSKEGTTE